MPSDRQRYAKITMTITLLLSLLILAVSCKECPTEPDYDIYLSVEDIACVWVTLKITLPDSGKIKAFSLERNDSTVATYTFHDDDTLIFDEGLTPDTDYSYRVRFLKDDHTKATSEPITIHTLPTTSHNFIWEVDTLGDYGSYLKDVWVVDENEIWVVGNIETDSGEYNAAHWDGTGWELLGIYSNTLNLYNIFYFSENDIWVLGSYPIHWDGKEWTHYHLTNMGVIPGGLFNGAIWGSDPHNVYFVGRNGRIVHYDGHNFEKMGSPNDTKLLAVSGNDDGSYVFAAGYDVMVPTKTTALMIHNGIVHEMYYSDYLVPRSKNDYGAVSAVGVYGNIAYFVTYQGLWKYNFKYDISIIERVIKNYDYCPMIVQAPNDILLIGGGFRFAHYNGESWDLNNDIYNQNAFADYGADLKGNIAVIVGYVQGGSHGIVAIGRR